ncbi:MAG: type IV secretion system protein [Anaplasma sp.]
MFVFKEELGSVVVLRIVPVVVLVLLSGCGYHGCISQQDVMNDKIRSVVYTDPKRQGDGSRLHWVKVDLPMKDKNINLKVEHYGINFCSGAEVREVKLEASLGEEIVQGKPKKFTVDFPVPIMPGETIQFSLVPVRKFTVTNDICRNQDEDIYVVNVEDCINNLIGQERFINFSHKLEEKQGFMNAWYEVSKDNPAPPFVSGFYPHIIPGNVSEEELKKRFVNSEATTNTNSDEDGTYKYLCYNDYDIAAEVQKQKNVNSPVQGGNLSYTTWGLKKCVIKCQPFGEYGHRPGSTGVAPSCRRVCQKVDGEGGGGNAGVVEEVIDRSKLNSLEKQVLLARAKYQDRMDEFAVNVGCGVLRMGESSQHNRTSPRDTPTRASKGHAYHLVSYGASPNTGVLGTKVLPFVKVVTPEIKVVIPENGSIATLRQNASAAANTAASAEANEPDATMVTLEEAKKALPDVDEYLKLDQNYELKGQNGTGVSKIELQLEPKSTTSSSSSTSGGFFVVGSYKISVRKDCGPHMEKSLYYTFSEGYPDYDPGAANTHVIEFLKSDTTVIPSSHSNGGDLYYGVRDNGDGYDNNTGFFEIQATAPRKPPRVISHVVTWVEERVRTALYGTNKSNSVVANMYGHISRRGAFINLVNALLILYILINSLYFFLGFSKASIFQLFCIFAKIITVMYVIRPDSWTFFNDHLFNLFINAPKDLINIMTGDTGAAGDFGFMDGILFRFTVSQTWLQILALIFAGPIGWISVALIFWGLFVLVQCLFSAVVIYLVSMMLIALLLSIAPFFLICILFVRTKAIFDAWIKVLLQTAMQPVVVFSCIALLVQAINNVIYAMLNFQVCDSCVLSISLKIVDLCVLYFLVPMGIVPAAPVNDVVRELYNTGDAILIGLPGPFFNILIFIAIAHAARDFVISSGEMCSIMFGAFTNLSDVGSGAAQSLLSIVGMDRATGQMADHQERQAELHGRGAGAGREEGALSRAIPGERSESPAAQRRPVFVPQDPPSSFGGGGSRGGTS